jgi:hypothetical protein
MERIDKIFVVLASLVVIVLLITKATPRNVSKQPASRLMLSECPNSNLVGPAYLTSNLPLTRQNDDTIPATSIGANEATGTGATAV